ncbi:MAG: THUMP domain-containing protein [Zestosphaera sp.]
MSQGLRAALKGSGTPIIRIIPVDHVVEPYVDEVADVVKEIATQIPEGSSFRITLQGHLISVCPDGRRRFMHSIDSIREIAKYVERPVNLENPDWVILIKVVKVSRGRRAAAVALLKPAELVNLRDYPQAGSVGEELGEQM